MKTILLSSLAVLALAIPAHASTITISLVNPNQTGSAGQTLQYFGILTNNTNSTVNLDGDDLVLNAPGVTLTDDFNNNVPFFLAPDGQAGSSSGIIELFDVTLSSGFSGRNIGTYDLVGDTGGNSFLLNTTTFSVAPTPEPASIFLLLSSLPAALPLLRRRKREPVAPTRRRSYRRQAGSVVLRQNDRLLPKTSTLGAPCLASETWDRPIRRAPRGDRIPFPYSKRLWREICV